MILSHEVGAALDNRLSPGELDIVIEHARLGGFSGYVSPADRKSFIDKYLKSPPLVMHPPGKQFDLLAVETL